MKIKVCGMKYPDNIRKVAALKPDYMGFIFYPGSPRQIDLEEISKSRDSMGKIQTVGVFVNSRPSEIIHTCRQLFLDYVQLHGDESPETAAIIKNAGIGIIKVWRMDDTFEFKSLNPFKSVSDYFLFDTAGKGFGGTGKKFNWEQLQEYEGEKPFFLSGGIGIEDISALLTFKHPNLWAVDVNSRMEIEPGLKDIERLSQFMEGINHEQHTSG